MNLTKILFSIIAITIVACNNGGVNNQQQLPTNIFINDPIPPSPFPPQGKYNGQLYSLLKTPPGLGLYPNSYLPNTPQSNALNIAYGGNTESQISDMTALVLINKDGKHFNYLCSATPVSYDSKTNTTFLIGAAHCFVNNKDNLNILTKNNLIPAEHLQIHNGINKDGSTGYAVKAVYLMQNYCYGNTFPEGGACSNFTPSDGAKNGQGNDLAIVQISGKYANPDNYPHIVKSIEYPQKYTMAPVLSIGYGINTQIPENDPPCNSSTCARMFYVANYFYWQQDSDGYHYLYHSYYNENKATPYLDGYANLICGGDSGGGDIFWTGEKWILLSEHTYGPSNSCGGFYKYLTNAATNVSAYYDWIKNIINSPDPISLCNNQTYNCVSNE